MAVQARWRLLVLACVLASLLVPALASASTGLYAETRVRGLQLGNPSPIRAERAVTLGTHQGYAVGYDELASDYLLAARGGRAVIGKLDDIAPGKLAPGENNLLKHLEGDLGSPQANWGRNSSVLRTEMNKGLPIRDASVNPMTGERLNNTGFLRAERNLLENHGWTYDPSTTLWTPPVP
jgi:hypothetical protein